MLRAFLKGNYKSWDKYLSYIEFVYNRVVHKIIGSLLLSLCMVLIPYTFGLDTSLTINYFVHKKGVFKANFVKKLHESVKT